MSKKVKAFLYNFLGFVVIYLPNFICSGHCYAFARHLDTHDRFYGGVISSTQVSSNKNPRWRKDIHEVALFKRSKRSEVIKNPEETQFFY